MFAMLTLLGCTIPPISSSSIEQFQTYDTQTTWTPAKQTAIPEKMAGWKIDKLMNGSQVTLTSPKGVMIYYSEYIAVFLPALTISEKKLRSHGGYGQMEKIPEIDKPIFKVDKVNSVYIDNPFIVGFVGNRKFTMYYRVANLMYLTDESGMQISHKNEKQVCFDEAVSLALDVYDRLSK